MGRRYLKCIFYITFIISILLFVNSILEYFNFNYNTTFLMRRGLPDFSLLWRVSFFVHMISGALFWLLALFQFFSFYSPRTEKIHPYTGRLAASFLLLCAISGSYSSLSGLGNFVFKIGLLFAFFIWLVAIMMAIIRIRQKNVSAHVDWMIRVMSISLSIISFRFFNIIFRLMFDLEYEDSFILAGTGFFVNLVLAEVFIFIKNKNSSKIDRASSV